MSRTPFPTDGDRPGSAPSGAGCLDDAVVAALVDETADPETLRRAIEHLAVCGSCREVLASVTRSMQDVSVRRAVADAEGRGLRRFWRPTAIAAAAIVAVLLWPNRDITAPPDQQHRAPEGAGSFAPVPASPVGVVSQAGTLRWRSVAGADRYRVRVFDADGRVRFETQLADTVAVLPDTVSLARGVRYFWSIDARTDFDRWTQSGLIEFSIAPQTPDRW